MNKKQIYWGMLLGCILGLNTFAQEKQEYQKSYTVVASEQLMAKEEWKEVVDALVKKHQAQIITYKNIDGADSTLEALKKQFPKYVCFVMTPEEIKYKQVVKVHRMMRAWDDDPYSDAIYSFITGPNAASAKRMALATEPAVINSALISSAIGTERYKEAYIISDGQQGAHGIKKASDHSAVMQVKNQDMTQFFVDGWNQLDPDILLTSAHASQRNLEMPFSCGNIVCDQGKLYGLPNQRMIDYSTGQAKKNISIKDGKIPLDMPKKPKVVFCVGNCLIGDIPDQNCMALAFMGYGMANQYIGYSTTTWFGMAGWTILKLWEQNAGVMPLNEAYYFSNQNLLKSLNDICPNEKNFQPAYETSHIDRAFFTTIRNTPPVTIRQLNRNEQQQMVGMFWDRDAVIMYGDPAFESRLNPKNLPTDFLPTRTFALEQENGHYIFTIMAQADCEQANQDTAPGTYYFPQRLQNIKVMDAAGMSPVITDNFIMIQDLKAMKKGEVLKVSFSADIIK